MTTGKDVIDALDAYLADPSKRPALRRAAMGAGWRPAAEACASYAMRLKVRALEAEVAGWKEIAQERGACASKLEAERDALKDAARALDAALNRFANWLILRAPVDNTPSQRGVMGTDIDDARKALRTLLNKEPG